MQRRMLALFPLLLLAGCFDAAHDCKRRGNCGDYDGSLDTGGTSGAGGTHGGAGGLSGDGGEGASPTAGAGGSAGGAGSCDSTANPAENTCVIHEDYGIFVSPEGDDEAGDGTQDAPFATLTKAIEVAAEDDKHVYACNTDGDYTEALRLDENAAGVALFGGFDCDTWAYDTGSKARIAPSSPEPVIANSADGLALYDLEIVAGDASEASGSSIALQLLDTDAELVRVVLTAGEGAEGEQPAREDYDYPSITELAGCDALDDSGFCSNSGGDRCSYTCPGGGTTQGGTRGGPTQGGGAGEPGSTENPNGGVYGTCNVDAQKGRDGAAGADGDGATTHGSLDSAGWRPSSGESGGPGSVGQGGGGGPGGATGTGGGGGCGGCGGAGARAGTGGGSSIALLVYNSATTLTECTLTTSDAGNGGDAQEGQRGQYNDDDESVAGFGGVQEVPGCPGGGGGIGGDGGASGGGAGGLSVGILYSGTEPSLDDATTRAITTGSAGNGGSPVSTSANTAGVDGVAEATLDLS